MANWDQFLQDVEYLTSPEPYTGHTPKDFLEAAKTMGSGAFADVTGGVAALAALPFVGNQGASEILEDIQNRWTYQPKGKAAETLQDIAESWPMQQVDKFREYSGNRMADMSSIISPELAPYGYALGAAGPEIAGTAVGGPSAMGAGRRMSNLLDDATDTSGINKGQFGQGGSISKKLSKAAKAKLDEKGIPHKDIDLKGYPYTWVSDRGFKWLPDADKQFKSSGMNQKSARLQDVLYHPLMEADPEFGRSQITKDWGMQDNVKGLYNRRTDEVKINPMHGGTQTDPDVLKSTVMHETGHRINSGPGKYETGEAYDEPTAIYPRGGSVRQGAAISEARKARGQDMSVYDGYRSIQDETVQHGAENMLRHRMAMEAKGDSDDYIDKVLMHNMDKDMDTFWPVPEKDVVNPFDVDGTEKDIGTLFDDSMSMSDPNVPVRAETAAPARSKRTRAKSGQYIGAPAGVDSPQSLAKIRRDYEKTATEGAGGADWYHDSSDFISDVTPDATRAQEVADTMAITSAGTGVDPNMGHAIKAGNQFATGRDPLAGRFPNQMGPLMGEVLSGNKPELGLKREPFAQNLSVNWAPERGVRPVHDIWDGRAWGWQGKNGKPYEGGFTAPQHAWMDEQAKVVDERMNKKQAAGRSDWNPLRTQAAAWTGEKIKSGQIKPEDAATHYGSYADKYTGYGTNEQIPGAGTGQLEGIVDASPEVREAYSNDPNSSWLNEKGQDFLYADAGVLTQPSNQAKGIYTPESTGVTEFNPQQVARPLLSRSSGKPTTVNPWDEEIMDMTEGYRAYVDAQNAGAWHKLIKDNPAGVSTGVHVPQAGSPDQGTIGKLQDLANEQGFFAVDTGEGLNMINDPFSGVGAARAKAGGGQLGKDLKGDFGEQIRNITGGDPQRVDIQSGYRDYEDVWPQGKGAATQRFLETMDINPEYAKKLDTPAARQKSLNNMLRDIEYSEKYGLPIREDIQYGRKIMGEEGIEGLRRQLKENPDLLAALMKQGLMGAV